MQIHRVADRFALQNPPGFLGALRAHLGITLHGIKSHVRREQHTGMAAQTLVVERFALDHVKPGVGDLPRIQGRQQGVEIDTRATSRVDDVRAPGQPAIASIILWRFDFDGNMNYGSDETPYLTQVR